MNTVLISAEPAEGNRRRLIFTHDGIGPFVEDRPMDEDIDTFLADHAAAVEASMAAVEPEAGG